MGPGVEYKIKVWRPSHTQLRRDLDEWFTSKGMPYTLATMQLSRVLPDPCEFLRKLSKLHACFKTSERAVNLQSGYLAQVLASLVESEVSCANTEVYTMVDHRIHLTARGAAAAVDVLTDKVAVVLEEVFGTFHMTLGFQNHDDGDGTTTYETHYDHRAPAGDRGWQITRAHQLLTDLNVHATQQPMDRDAPGTLTTLDGWIWNFSSCTWTRNTLRAGMFRVCAKTRAELSLPDDLLNAIAVLWHNMRVFEAAGGRSVVYGEDPSPQPVHEAFHALLALPSGQWLKSLYECLSEDIDLTMYLIKHACRSIAGLKFVELIILHGPLRSSKDTFVSAPLEQFTYTFL